MSTSPRMPSRQPTAGSPTHRGPGWRSAIVAMSAIILAGVIPVLEVNESHLFSPYWPAHARFHEAWQLLTNAGLALAALWLAAVHGRERLAAGLSLIVAGSLIVACVLGGLYGGAISRPGSEEFRLFGLSSPILIMAALALALLAAVWPERRRPIHL